MSPKNKAISLFMIGLPELRMRAYSVRMRDMEELKNAAKKLSYELPADFSVTPTFIIHDEPFSLPKQAAASAYLMVMVAANQLANPKTWLKEVTEIWNKFDNERCLFITTNQADEAIKSELPAHMQARIVVADTSFESISQQVFKLCALQSAEPAAESSQPTNKANGKANTAVDTLSRTQKIDLLDTVDKLMAIEGAVAVTVVDGESRQMLAQAGDSQFNLKIAAEYNLDVIKASRDTLVKTHVEDDIESILITLREQYHVVQPLKSNSDSFVYVVLDKSLASLALARPQIQTISKSLMLN